MIDECNQVCFDSCQETLFTASYQGGTINTISSIFLTFEESNYYIIRHFPKMLFLQLMISIVNIFNAWHGLSFIKILEYYSNLNNSSRFKRFSTKVKYFSKLCLFKYCKTQLKVSIPRYLKNKTQFKF